MKKDLLKGLLMERCLCILAVFTGLTIARSDVNLDLSVGQIFQTKCSECHVGIENKDAKGAKGKDPILNATTRREDLLKSGQTWLVLGNPKQSDIFERIIRDDDDDGRMPLNRKKKGEIGYVAKLTEPEILLIKKWIENKTEGANTFRPFVSSESVVIKVIEDLERLPKEERKHYKYLTLHNRHNLPIALEPDEHFAVYVAALAKLLNSLSWQPKLVAPLAIDTNKLIYRFDLRSYGWTNKEWDLIASADPYSIERPEADARINKLTDTTSPVVVRADWFVFACAQTPLYEKLLFEPVLPGFLKEGSAVDKVLEKYLNVDVAKNLLKAEQNSNSELIDELYGGEVANTHGGSVIRAGFIESGVSQANRLIERHPISETRAYWKSYDFAVANLSKDHNLALSPLGPIDAQLSTDLAFRHDGGEIIFTLPNGLQGYLLIDSNGKFLSRAPDEVVINSNRKDLQILNGISCINCHNEGMKEPPKGLRDNVGPSVKQALFPKISARDRNLIKGLYRSDAELIRTVRADGERFKSAAKSLNGLNLRYEPISFLYDRFLDRLTIARLPAELDLDASRFKKPIDEVLAKSDDEQIREAALRLVSGVPRREFITLFRILARELTKSKLRPAAEIAYEEFRNKGKDRDQLEPKKARIDPVNVLALFGLPNPPSDLGEQKVFRSKLLRDRRINPTDLQKFKGKSGRDSQDGQNGENGFHGSQGSSKTNPSVAGSPGGNGRNGTRGDAGQNCQDASVTIREVNIQGGPIGLISVTQGTSSNLFAIEPTESVLFSFVGGDGAAGGKGGNGGQGGNGGWGIDQNDGTVFSTGMAGGRGGDGGNGQPGGDGGNGAIVKVRIEGRTNFVALIKQNVKFDVQGGKGGAGGSGGTGGNGGEGGRGGYLRQGLQLSNGRNQLPDGKNGERGNNGSSGVSGSRGQKGDVIFDEHVILDN